MRFEVSADEAAGLPEMMTPERVMADEVKREDAARDEGVGLGRWERGSRIVVWGFGEKVYGRGGRV